MDVVFTSYLAVAGYIDTYAHLFQNYFPGGTVQQFFCFRALTSAAIVQGFGWIFDGGALFLEPVRDGYVARRDASAYKM